MKSYIYSFLLLILIANASFAQKITFSDKEFDKAAVLQVLGESDRSIFYFKISYENREGVMMNGADIEQFDFNLNLEKEIPRKLYHSMLKKKQNYIGRPIIFNNKVTFLTQTGRLFGPWELNLYQPFDSIESPVIDTIHPTHITFDMNRTFLALNHKGSLFIGSNWWSLTKIEPNNYYYVIDKNLKKIALSNELQESLKERHKISIVDFYDNFLITMNPYGVYDIEKGKFTKMNEWPKIDGVDFANFYIAFDSSNNYLTYHNLYKRNKTIYKNEIFSGHFSFTYDLNTGNFVTSKNNPFDENAVAELSKIKTDRGKEQAISSVYITENGGNIYIVESYNPFQSDRLASGASAVSYEKEFNIYFVSIDKNGKFNWMSKIERKENISSRKGRTDWGNYAVLKLKNDVLHVFLNDDDKVLDYTIDLSGNVSKRVLFGDEKDAAYNDVFIFPIYAYHKSDSEIIMPFMKNRKISLMQISY